MCNSPDNLDAFLITYFPTVTYQTKLNKYCFTSTHTLWTEGRAKR